MEIMSHISSCYPNLSRSQKMIADYILKHPEEACFASLKEFTEAVNTTEVTVVNFTRKIGVNSFLALKKELQAYIRMRLSPNDKLYRAVGGIADMGGVYRDYVENEQAALAYTFDNLNGDELNRCVSLLKHASHVYIVGYDSSLPVAAFMMMRLHYLGVQTTQLDFANPSQLLLEIESADIRAIFVLISFPTHAPQMINLAKVLNKNKLQTMVISDQTTAPVALSNSIVLPCSTGDLLFYNSITAPISLVNLICTLLAVETKSDFRATRDRIQALHTQIFWPDDQK
ncbi:MAG: MurR/RpiR family transcriptional regulator [Angelakisella sp.]|nr:MurR/RpiR family transcriptional regulator [Angelakisella sp.]